MLKEDKMFDNLPFCKLPWNVYNKVFCSKFPWNVYDYKMCHHNFNRGLAAILVMVSISNLCEFLL